MKRILVLLLMLCAAFLCLVGCNFSMNDSSSENSNDNSIESSSCEHMELYEWVSTENGHRMRWLCGCYRTEVEESHIDSDKDAYCDECRYYVGVPYVEPIEPFLRPEVSFFDVIDELKETDIQRVETIQYPGAVSPDLRSPIEHRISTLAEDKDAMYNWLQSLKNGLAEIPASRLPSGNSPREVRIYTAMYYFKIIEVWADIVRIGSDYYTQTGTTPQIEGEKLAYRFGEDSKTVDLLIDNEKVKEYNIDFGKLLCIKTEFNTSGKKVYELASGIFEKYFVYDERHFIKNTVSYEIVSEYDFSQIFEDFPLDDSEEGFFVGAYPQEFTYQNRRYCNLQSDGVMDSEIGELLGYIIREEDVSAFTNEYPGVDYVIDAGIYDYYNKNRVPFYAVQGYEDLSVICLYASGAYELFQDVTNFLSGDFSFSLTWNVDGISSYDSITGKLVKTKDTSEPELYMATHYLTEDEKTQILDILLGLDVLFYPNIYNPTAGLGSNPSQDLILSVQSGDIIKTITAKGIALSTDATNERGQKYINACEAISKILMETEEWKSLPDYPYIYD